ncbi:hypothetical protein M0R04_08630 [Candidatus Dojkabacteria bacterium]|jgi:hypothetical protein|nr:hypothetical protein [Candidatus Dojkabacteria bacterium]
MSEVLYILPIVKKWAKDETNCHKCHMVIRKENYYQIGKYDYHRKFECSGIKEDKNEMYVTADKR